MKAQYEIAANIMPYAIPARIRSSSGIALNRNVIIIENTMRGAFEVVVLAAADRPPEDQANQRHHYDG